jgi:hypothetical protein
MSYRVIVLTDINEAAMGLILSDSLEGDITDRVRLPHDAFTNVDGGAADVLEFAARHIGPEREITIICDRVPLYVWDDATDDQTRLHEFADQARSHGWTAGAGIELRSGWITWTRENLNAMYGPAGEIAVHMGIRRMMADTDEMIKPEDTADEIAVRLARYAGLVGAAYRAMPGVAGLAALRNLWDRPTMVKTKSGLEPATRKQPRWRWDRRHVLDGPVIDKLHGAGDLNWRREPQDHEKAMGHVWAFDVRAMYLAAAASVMLGHDAPTNMGAIGFDESLAGFWRIDTNGHRWARPSAGVPIINSHRILRDGSTWVTTPVLRYIRQVGMPMPEILDSWVSTYSGKWLEGWAKQLRDALPDAVTAGDPRLRGSIKGTYVEAIAMMSTPGGRIFRPDWTWLIRDEARMRLIRKVHKAYRDCAVWPLRVKVDCVWYPSPLDDPAPLLAMIEPKAAEGWIGQFRLDKVNSVHMPIYLTEDMNRPRRRRLRKDAE